MYMKLKVGLPDSSKRVFQSSQRDDSSRIRNSIQAFIVALAGVPGLATPITGPSFPSSSDPAAALIGTLRSFGVEEGAELWRRRVAGARRSSSGLSPVGDCPASPHTDRASNAMRVCASNAMRVRAIRTPASPPPSPHAVGNVAGLRSGLLTVTLPDLTQTADSACDISPGTPQLANTSTAPWAKESLFVLRYVPGRSRTAASPNGTRQTIAYRVGASAVLNEDLHMPEYDGYPRSAVSRTSSLSSTYTGDRSLVLTCPAPKRSPGGAQGPPHPQWLTRMYSVQLGASTGTFPTECFAPKKTMVPAVDPRAESNRRHSLGSHQAKLRGSERPVPQGLLLSWGLDE
ncbi:hypothetical protein B0H15DRAFT_804960 [Mycena belliarum]|uniref:Uncharacterized protein n=1 Tax=Mycena belliarum TaxID=1033014 RepID=A0AAD6XJ40_9AGAR|nr:hypothetical protein B0H15DRAFT_804960 [Mycena belliae]